MEASLDCDSDIATFVLAERAERQAPDVTQTVSLRLPENEDY